MRGIGVVEAATIGAELFDRNLTRGRTERNGLLSDLLRRGFHRLDQLHFRTHLLRD